jgi:hypothetical protein
MRQIELVPRRFGTVNRLQGYPSNCSTPTLPVVVVGEEGDACRCLDCWRVQEKRDA